ncbi:MAG: hypothetical protein IKS48_07845, partial [Eubacterium sp.]|nr:hypothetical protein [Eubacterium sp.]
MKYQNIIAVTLIFCVFLSCLAVPSKVRAEGEKDTDTIKSEIVKDSVEFIKSSKNTDKSFGYNGLINDTAESVAVLKRFSD